MCSEVFSLAESPWTSFTLLSPIHDSSACSRCSAIQLGSFQSSASVYVSMHPYTRGCPWSAQATWLAIFCGYYYFLRSKPFSTRQKKWDLNSRKLQGQSALLNSSIRLCQRERNGRTKGNDFGAKLKVHTVAKSLCCMNELKNAKKWILVLFIINADFHTISSAIISDSWIQGGHRGKGKKSEITVPSLNA